jgi:signal-transduction protein with cAMP-binding, CBS, and nucleotidyltransferase domain
MDLPTLVGQVRGQRVTPETWVFINKAGVWQRAMEVPELQWFFQVKQPGGGSGSNQNPLGLDFGVLRRLKLFSGMTDEQLDRFTQYAEIQKVPLSATIVKQGDRGDAMYVILEGELSVRMNIGSQQETTLATLRPGDFFGDIALFDHGPRSADVVATSGSSLLRISAKAFDDMSREAPELATPFLRALGKTLTARIRAGNKHHGESVMMSRSLQ